MHEDPLRRRPRLSRRERHRLVRVRARLPRAERPASPRLHQSQRDVELRLRGVPPAVPVRHQSRRLHGAEARAHSHQLLRPVPRAAGLHHRGDGRLSATHARVAVRGDARPGPARRTVRALQVAAAGVGDESDARLGKCSGVEVVRPGRQAARSIGVAARAVPDSGAADVAGALHRTVSGVVRPGRRPPDHAEGVGRLPGAGRVRYAGPVRRSEQGAADRRGGQQ